MIKEYAKETAINLTKHNTDEDELETRHMRSMHKTELCSGMMVDN